VEKTGRELPDFFISRAGRHPADVEMAAKIGQVLEAAYHRVVLQQWDFADHYFIEGMDAALSSGARVIAILTPEYLASDYCAAEWMHVLHPDPLNRRRRLILLRVAECEPKGLLCTIGYWDLVSVSGRDDLLATIVKTAIMPDAERRGGNDYWRKARPLLHDHIKPTASFTGREAELLKIDNALWSGKVEAAAITQPTAVTGLGGIGKSTLAREYGWRAQEGYAGVWWLDAASDKDALTWEGVEQGLVAIGDHYIKGLAQAQDRTKAAQHALDFLAYSGFEKPWLIIYDNVDDPRVLDVWRPHGNVHALITSRIGHWRQGIDAINVEEWPLNAAITYLRNKTFRSDIQDNDFSRLADALGRLPLALSHAAAYLRRRKAETASDYIADLDRHMRELPKDAEYRSPVFATYRAALRQAEEKAPGAIALMSLAAYFAPDDIPEQLYEQDLRLYPPELAALVSRKSQLRDALDALDDLSLIAFDAAARKFSVHRLVQAAARDALGSMQDAWAVRAIALIAAALPKPAPATWSTCVMLARHARALASHAPVGEVAFNLGVSLGIAGDSMRERVALAGALSLFAAYHALMNRLAKADPGNAGWQYDLGISNERIGDVLLARGNLDDALKHYRAKNEIISRLAGADSGNAEWQRDLSVSHNKIGGVLVEQGNLPAALESFDASLAIIERLAKADPENAGWQYDLGISNERIGDALLAQGNLDAALKHYRAKNEIISRLAEADPGNAGWRRDLSVSHNKIGSVLVEQGNLPAALESFGISLAIAERLAKADPENAGWQYDLGISNERIGDVLLAQGNLDDALKHYRAKNESISRLAMADPENAGWRRDLSVSHIKIGDVLVGQGNLPAALESFGASLAIAERLAKADPENAGWQRDVAVSNERLGDIYARQGQRQETIAAFERALAAYNELIRRNPGDAESRVFSVVPLWRLGGLKGKHGRKDLEAALAILKPLAAAERLDANRRGWIAQIERQIGALEEE
jgi:tetratricopeptide (TPR) repeat protein